MSPFLESVHRILTRDLDRLEREIRAYAADELLWVVRGEINNSAGTLCLHLCGNLQHYFGAVLGGTGYRRDRAAEFARRGVSREDLLQQIDAARAAVSL